MTERLRRPVNLKPPEGMRDAAKGRRAKRPLQTDCLGELANIEIPSDGRPKFDPLPDLLAAWKARRMKIRLSLPGTERISIGENQCETACHICDRGQREHSYCALRRRTSPDGQDSTFNIVGCIEFKQAAIRCVLTERQLPTWQGLINQTILDQTRVNSGSKMGRCQHHNRLATSLALIAWAFVAMVCSNRMAIAAEMTAEQAVVAIRMAGTEQKSEIEIDFEGNSEASPNLLPAPHRLVIDMPETMFAMGEIKIPKGGFLKSMRQGLVQAGRSRMVLSYAGPFAVDTFSVAPAETGNLQTLKITVSKSDDAAFAKALSGQILTTSAVAGGKGDRIVAGSTTEGFNIVIDPGHGGIDSGAIGISGTMEKRVTLNFSKLLADRLNKFPGLKARLTRDDDRFIALDERVRSARQLNAHLLISIHADTIRDKSLRGATVYTLSEKASDEVAQAVAQQENLSDAIGGVSVPVEDQHVADILIDLTRRETKQFSNQFAQVMVESLKHKTQMINNPHRSAGFRVLKAPDVPSVLVELGYLSNPEDEKSVSDPKWQADLADEMAEAIRIYAGKQVTARQ
jgi:N-acetylmuramoyl-L-alanine amidase